MSHTAEPRLRRPLIWITDDSTVEARITERALGPDYDFEYFSDGSHVVERLAAGGRQPDVLLLDWVMPGMMGDEVCRFLRAHPPTAELPIILVTASRIETRDVVEGLSIGANDYVPRPFVAQELRARVDTAIRAKRLRELAARERDRVATVGRLGRAFVEAGPRVEGVLDALASSLVTSLADGCAITIVTGAGSASIARHRSPQHAQLLAGCAALADPCVIEFASSADALAKLPKVFHPAIRKLGMSALAVIAFPTDRAVTGMVILTRDGHSEPFEAADLATVQTCIEYAAMAIENASRFEAERQARAQLETVLHALPISILVVDRDRKLTFANPAARDAIPSPPQLDQLLHADVDGPVERALRGESVRAQEIALDDRFVRASSVPLRDAHGHVTAALAAFEDVTDERAAAIEREHAAEFQQYVLGIVSHDLRNPLSSIAMGCELLHNRTDDPEMLRLVERLQGTAGRMERIINQLLDVTRARLDGALAVQHREADLETIVTGVLEELSLAYPHTIFEPKLEHVRGAWDADRLAQVVSNLVGNAIMHGAAAAPVWIEAQREGSDALIRVRNVTTGAPITSEQEQAMFAPLRRTARPGSSGEAGAGVGLGLYIATEILRAHRGRISVESNSQTTTFTVRLPIAPQP